MMLVPGQGLCVLVFSRACGARWFKWLRFLRAESPQKTQPFTWREARLRAERENA
jgi:hypothetical protein